MRGSQWMLPVLLGLGSCISTNPPPPVRWFDPSTEWSGPAGEPSGKSLLLEPVLASPFLRQEMVWRIRPRELFVDDGNRWIAEPRVLVQQALEVALFAGGTFRRSETSLADEIVEVEVVAFEGDLTAQPAARVRLLLRAQGRSPWVVEAAAPAAGDGAAELAEAMAVALRRAALQVRDRLLEE